MSSSKRSATSSKSPHSSKQKEAKAGPSSRSRTEDASSGSDSPGPSIPIIRQVDNLRLLPRYAAVLNRNVEEGIGMEDLDQLQHDLERMLSNVGVRQRMLLAEIESLESGEDRKKNKKGKSNEKQPLKRKRSEERNKQKDSKSGIARVPKIKPTLPINTFVSDLPVKREVPKVNFPKNDTSDKFWLSVEPYCNDVTKEDAIFLDNLIKECSEDVNLKIPELGSHYAVDWADEVISHEQSMGNAERTTKPKTANFNNELKRNGLNAMVDTFSSPLTQRLLAALIEEKVVTSPSGVSPKLKPSDFSVPKGNNRSQTGSCLDKRLRKELIEQGILDAEDIVDETSSGDEIYAEIIKCMQELKAVNAKNVTELSKLRTIVTKDLRRQEIKAALDKVDNQIMDVYNKMMISKQTKSALHSEDDNHKPNNGKQSTNEIDEEVNRLIQQQLKLQKELKEITVSTIPF